MKILIIKKKTIQKSKFLNSIAIFNGFIVLKCAWTKIQLKFHQVLVGLPGLVCVCPPTRLPALKKYKRFGG